VCGLAHVWAFAFLSSSLCGYPERGLSHARAGFCASVTRIVRVVGLSADCRTCGHRPADSLRRVGYCIRVRTVARAGVRTTVILAVWPFGVHGAWLLLRVTVRLFSVQAHQDGSRGTFSVQARSRSE
jgi:hypothetical protein